MSQSKRSAGRRLSVITVDQAIAGSSNVLIAVLAARLLGVGAFGLFGIVFIVAVTGLGVSRALICDPLLVHPVEARERPGDVIGAAGVLGVGVGILVCSFGLLAWIWDDQLGGALVILGVCIPALVVQDLGRYLGFVTRRPAQSLVLDLTWLALMIVLIGALVAADAESLCWFVAAWAGSGAIAGGMVPFIHRRHPIRYSSLWLRETWDLSWRYLLTFAATQGSALTTSVGIAAISGVRALGAVRGALLLVRPSATLQAASTAAGIAEIAHLGKGSRQVQRHVNRTTAVTTVAAFANLLVLVTLPDEVGRAVLGATWGAAQPLMLPAGVQIVLLALVSGPRAALLGQRAIRITMRIDIVNTLLLLVAALAGALVNGALGAYWATAVSQVPIAAIWWFMYFRHADRGGARTAAEDRQTGESASPPPAGP